MSDSSNKYYVPTPIAADYEAANSSVIAKASKFGVKSHRLLSAKGKNANVVDVGANNFKYLEDVMFSNRNVKIDKESAPSMFDIDYIDKVRKLDNCTYKVLRFDRSHNIRSFDFIITYTQVSSFGADKYKPVTMTKQFIGSLLFTGCSIVRDTDTMEEIPLKLYGKYESVGDTINNALDIDANNNAKGGPTIRVKYTFDKNYIYLFIDGISPFRLIPVGDGEFVDISYAENRGSLVGEIKEDLSVTTNPFTGAKKKVSFTGDGRVWCDVALSLKDTTISHDINNAEFIDFDEEALSVLATTLREQEIDFIPTNDGEQIVIGMEPSSTVNLEIAPDVRPIRFGTSLLNSSKPKILEYINKLKTRIINSAVNIEKVPFSIKTSIRVKGKYNIAGKFFIDNQADSFGNIIINDVGVYDAITDKFDIVEYIFDKNQSKGSLNKVGQFNEYTENASDYLSSISINNKQYPKTRKTNDVLDVLKDIDFEMPAELDVYFNVAFIKNNLPFEVISAYAEFGDDENDNSDDNVIYICKDGKIRVVNFKDYNTNKVKEIDITDETITCVEKNEFSGVNKYYIGTDKGSVIVADNLVDENPNINKLLPFGSSDAKNEISMLSADDVYVFIGTVDGKVGIINSANDTIKQTSNHFAYGDKIIAAKNIDNDHIVFISKNEICSYRISSDKWNYEEDEYRTDVKFDNPFLNSRIPNPNLNLIIDNAGWLDVPTIQKGDYVYALGMRLDQNAGNYSPVYKKMNVLTGEVTELKPPRDENAKVYKGRLCFDGRYIYSVGGKSIATANDPLETRTVTYISVFDTATDTWISDGDSDFIVFGDGIVLDDHNDYYPVAFNGSIYIIHPKSSVITYNPDTNLWAINTRRIYKSYRIDVFVDQNDVLGVYPHELDESINSTFTNMDINVVPLIKDKREGGSHNWCDIYFFSGHPKYIDDSFKGYYLEEYKFTANFNKTVSVQLINKSCGQEYELVSLYDGTSIDAPNDLFGNISFYTEEKEATENLEAIVYCLSKFIFYISLIGSGSELYTEMHAVYHDIADSSKYAHPPLLSSGDWEAWKTYKKNIPSNVNLFKVDNFIYFVGGTNRSADILSLDSMSLIPAPRMTPRKIGVPESAVINDDNLGISFINEKKPNDLVSCYIGNTLYFVVTIGDGDDYVETDVYKFIMDDPSYDKPKLINRFNITRFNSGLGLIKPIESTNKLLLITKRGDIFIFDTNTNELVNTSYADHLVASLYDSETFIYSINECLITKTSDTDYRIRLFYQYNPTNAPEHECFNVDAMCDISIATNIVTSSNENVKILHQSVNDYINSDIRIINDLLFSRSPNADVIKVYDIDKNSYFGSKHRIDIDISKYVTNDHYRMNVYQADDIVYILVNQNVLYAFNTITNEVKYTIIDKGVDNHIDSLRRKEEDYLYEDGYTKYETPFGITRSGNLYLIDFGQYDTCLREDDDLNVEVYKTKISEDNFIKEKCSVDITQYMNNLSARYNRFDPTMSSMTIDGHELLLVLGGKPSQTSNPTNKLEIFDVDRNIWITKQLPAILCNISIKENVIYGATEIVPENGSRIPYAKKCTINCTNYDSLAFDIEEEAYPETDIETGERIQYPIYGKYDITEGILFILPTDETGCFDIENDYGNIIYVNLSISRSNVWLYVGKLRDFLHNRLNINITDTNNKIKLLGLRINIYASTLTLLVDNKIIVVGLHLNSYLIFTEFDGKQIVTGNLYAWYTDDVSSNKNILKSDYIVYYDPYNEHNQERHLLTYYIDNINHLISIDTYSGTDRLVGNYKSDKLNKAVINSERIDFDNVDSFYCNGSTLYVSSGSNNKIARMFTYDGDEYFNLNKIKTQFRTDVDIYPIADSYGDDLIYCSTLKKSYNEYSQDITYNYLPTHFVRKNLKTGSITEYNLEEAWLNACVQMYDDPDNIPNGYENGKIAGFCYPRSKGVLWDYYIDDDNAILYSICLRLRDGDYKDFYLSQIDLIHNTVKISKISKEVFGCESEPVYPDDYSELTEYELISKQYFFNIKAFIDGCRLLYNSSGNAEEIHCITFSDGIASQRSFYSYHIKIKFDNHQTFDEGNTENTVLNAYCISYGNSIGDGYLILYHDTVTNEFLICNGGESCDYKQFILSSYFHNEEDNRKAIGHSVTWMNNVYVLGNSIYIADNITKNVYRLSINPSTYKIGDKCELVCKIPNGKYVYSITNDKIITNEMKEIPFITNTKNEYKSFPKSSFSYKDKIISFIHTPFDPENEYKVQIHNAKTHIMTYQGPITCTESDIDGSNLSFVAEYAGDLSYCVLGDEIKIIKLYTNEISETLDKPVYNSFKYNTNMVIKIPMTNKYIIGTSDHDDHGGVKYHNYYVLDFDRKSKSITELSLCDNYSDDDFEIVKILSANKHSDSVYIYSIIKKQQKFYIVKSKYGDSRIECVKEISIGEYHSSNLLIDDEIHDIFKTNDNCYVVVSLYNIVKFRLNELTCDLELINAERNKGIVFDSNYLLNTNALVSFKNNSDMKCPKYYISIGTIEDFIHKGILKMPLQRIIRIKNINKTLLLSPSGDNVSVNGPAFILYDGPEYMVLRCDKLVKRYGVNSHYIIYIDKQQLKAREFVEESYTDTQVDSRINNIVYIHDDCKYFEDLNVTRLGTIVFYKQISTQGGSDISVLTLQANGRYNDINMIDGGEIELYSLYTEGGLVANYNLNDFNIIFTIYPYSFGGNCLSKIRPNAILQTQNNYIIISIQGGGLRLFNKLSSGRVVNTEHNMITENLIARLGLNNETVDSRYEKFISSVPLSITKLNNDMICITNMIVYSLNDTTISEYNIIFKKIGIYSTIINTPIDGVIDTTNVKYIIHDVKSISNENEFNAYVNNVAKMKLTPHFNPMKGYSEINSRYIGVDGNGEVIDAEVPVTDYEISHIEVSDDTNALALRSKENIKTTISLMHKTANKNVVAKMTAISRLNTSKFKALYTKTNSDEIGEIFAFTSVEDNGVLVRNDIAYYDGNYAVAIINDSILKINVDGEIYTYHRSNNEIPLSNNILPIVIAYDERINSDNVTECRYLSFVDKEGNLITYDKELKSFIDVSGYVDIDVPHFSTEAIIYPSKSNLLTDDKALIDKTN